MRKLLRKFQDDERGHAVVGLLSLTAAIGAVILGIGVAADSDAAAVIGGIVLGVGILAESTARHLTIDYDVYARLEKLEK